MPMWFLLFMAQNWIEGGRDFPSETGKIRIQNHQDDKGSEYDDDAFSCPVHVFPFVLAMVPSSFVSFKLGYPENDAVY